MIKSQQNNNLRRISEKLVASKSQIPSVSGLNCPVLWLLSYDHQVITVLYNYVSGLYWMLQSHPRQPLSMYIGARGKDPRFEDYQLFAFIRKLNISN